MSFAADKQALKHDPDDRLVEVAYPDGRLKRFIYDSAGNLLRVVTSTSGGAGNGRLPHTGITGMQCFQAGSNAMVSCTSAEAIALSGADKQDGMYGDTQPMSYSLVGSHTREECVKDDVTGLIWEGKTVDGMRSSANRYTNWGDGRFDDASSYVAAVNALGLCGYSDWRLPTVDELETIVDAGADQNGPSIRRDWFVNAHGTNHWTSTPAPSIGPNSFWNVIFLDGTVYYQDRGVGEAVRLVRSAG